jgi:hypothetical protein
MRRTLALLAAGAACSGALWFAHPAHAQPYAAGDGTLTVGDAAEAWYQTAPADPCSSPVGCPPASAPSPFPRDTLHVGEIAGTQTDAAYVQPDLSGVPVGEQPVAGTMVLPLATVNGNGSANTANAALVACLVTASIPDGTQGSTNTPPASDCGIKASVNPGADSFTVDLGPFIEAWNSGRPEYGIALLADTSQPSVWHVAFNGSNLTGAPHISSTLTLGAAPADALGAGGTGGTTGSVFGILPSDSGLQPSPPPAPVIFTPTNLAPTNITAANAATPAVVPATEAAPAVATPARPAASPPAQLALSGVSHGFQYPEVLLLPLALAAGMAFVLRLLISDATPKRKPA